MKNIKLTTAVIGNPLQELKAKRMSGTSITDKAMTKIEITSLQQGSISDIYMFESVDEETGEVINQTIFETVNGNYSTCSSVVNGLMTELIPLINEGVISLSQVGLEFSYKEARTGNKYLDCTIA